LFTALRSAEGRPANVDVAMIDEAAVGGTAALYSAAVRLRGGDRVAPLPILAIIDRQEPEARAAALQVVDDVLSRPIHLVEVVARIESLLRGRAALGAMSTRPLEDAMTGLRSRAFFDERVIEEWRRSVRFSEPLALLVVGAVGESARGANGERSLREVGAALRRALRQIDVLGRFGSREVAALLVNTHLAGALTCAERLRKELAPPAGQASIEVVMGLAFYPGKDVTSSAELVKTSQRALERATDEGPGSICLIQHQGYLFRGT
jgi:diguanylate cyclase (GGDEF)-like protein